MKEQLILPNEVQSILNTLNDCGYEAFVVGGCVRDSIIGIEPHDWDITTNALPNQIKDCFISYKTIDTGIKHGTVTIVIDGKSFEVTTYRIDGEYTDNRHPDSVQFTTSLCEDLSRRDFTINSMAYNHNVGLVDYYNGREDIERKFIRCVGNANDRFKEDALRIMRALRFSSTYEYRIDHNTGAAIHGNKNLLKNISVERIGSELNKLLCGNDVEEILNCFDDIISVIIPEVKQMVGFKQGNPYHYLDVWKHTTKSISEAPVDIKLRLTMLFHDIGKPLCFSRDERMVGHFYGHPQHSSDMAVDILKRMKYDNITITKVRDLVLYHDADISTKRKNIKRWLNKLGEETLKQLIQVKRADVCAQSYKYMDRLLELNTIERLIDNIIESQQCFCLKDLDINGSDLINIGVSKGVQVGKALNLLMSMVIDEEIENKKELLIECIQREYIND